MPFLMVGADRGHQVILIRPLLAAAVVLWLALLDADLGNVDEAVEVLVLRLIGRKRLFAGIAGPNAARAFEDLFQAAAIGERHLLLAGGRALQQKAIPELALRVRPVNDDEFAVEHFGVAPRRALEQSTLTDIAGPNPHLHGGNRVVRKDLGKAARVGSLRVVKRHGSLLYCPGGEAGFSRSRILAMSLPRCGGSVWSSFPERSLLGNPHWFGAEHTNPRVGLGSPKSRNSITMNSSTMAPISRGTFAPSICRRNSTKRPKSSVIFSRIPIKTTCLPRACCN